MCERVSWLTTQTATLRFGVCRVRVGTSHEHARRRTSTLARFFDLKRALSSTHTGNLLSLHIVRRKVRTQPQLERFSVEPAARGCAGTDAGRLRAQIQKPRRGSVSASRVCRNRRGMRHPAQQLVLKSNLRATVCRIVHSCSSRVSPLGERSPLRWRCRQISK